MTILLLNDEQMSNWLGVVRTNQVVSNPHLQAMNGRLEGEQPYLGDLLTMIINHLLVGGGSHQPVFLQKSVCYTPEVEHSPCTVTGPQKGKVSLVFR